MELIDHAWTISSACSNKRKGRAWGVSEDSYDQHEDCSIIYPIRGFNRNHKTLLKMFEYVDDKGLTIPNTWVLARYVRSDNQDYLRVSFALPQEHYGFPRERKFTNSESPWHVNNYHAFPKRKAFVEKVLKWEKSWRNLINKGFKNKLERSEASRFLPFGDAVLTTE